MANEVDPKVTEIWDKIEVVMKAAVGWKAKLLAANRGRGRASCPTCGGKNTMRVMVDLVGRKHHMRCRCDVCQIGFIE